MIKKKKNLKIVQRLTDNRDFMREVLLNKIEKKFLNEIVSLYY